MAGERRGKAARCVQATLFVATLLLLLSKGSDGSYAKIDEARIRDRILTHPNYSVAIRPALHNEETVEVLLSLQVYAMLDLNERDQVITTASWLRMQWRDPRLQWDPSEFGGVDYIHLLIDEIWTPRLFLGNAIEYDALTIITPERGSIILQSDGVAVLGAPLVLATQCPVWIRYFPYDTQACPFMFVAENAVTERIRFRAFDEASSAEIDSMEWSLFNFTSAESLLPFNIAPRMPRGNVSFTVFCLILQRDPSYYFKTVFLPSTLLCLMTFVTFLAPPDSGERISLGVSMVLGLTVFQLLIADVLPTASIEAPILSTYLSWNFIMACSAIPLSLLNVSIAFGDSQVLLLKYHWTRKLLLESLPRLSKVPPYSQRITDLGTGLAQIPKVNGWVEGSDAEGEKQGGAGVSFEELEGQIGRAEKTKIELRTVALVVDRLAILGFSLAFLVLLCVTILQLLQNPGIHPENGLLCSQPQP